MTTFSAQLQDFSDLAMDDLLAIFKASGQAVFRDAQLPVSRGGRMHVDTGFLRNSLTMSINGGGQMAGASSYNLALGKMKLGDKVFGGWTAEYAVHREFGARGQEPDWFMRGAAQKWPAIVYAKAMELTYG